MTTQPPAPTPASTAPAPVARQPQGWRKWLFRLAAMTLVPTAVLGGLELALRLGGYGYPTSFFIQRPEIIGREYYISNNDFGRRFFHPALVRVPPPMKLAAEKPAGTRRIFVLGESAALGWPEPSYSFARILDVLLRDQVPEQTFEIINTSFVAINSHVILPIARDCARHQPDFFVVFMGNNEVVGPFGSAGVMAPFVPSLPLIRTNLGIRTTRTGQLFHDAAQWWSTDKAPQDWEGMEMMQHSRVRASDPALDAMHEHFRQNLRDIVRSGAGAGASVIVSTVPVNLKDSPPFASMHAVDLPNDALGKWDQAYQEGIHLEEQKKWAEAVSRYEEADRIDGEYADLQFRWARCLLLLNQSAQAREKFLAARNLDALRFRTDQKLNAATRAVAQAEGAVLVDAEEIFAKESPDGIVGEEFFLEHVHLTFAGNYLLARCICEKLTAAVHDAPAQKKPILSQAECARRLAYTDWNRRKIAGQMQSIMEKPPFTQQLDHDASLKHWQTTIDKLDINEALLKSAKREYAEAMQNRADDWTLTLNYADLLKEWGDRNRAAIELEKVTKSEPYLVSARADLALQTAALGDFRTAKAEYQLLIKIAPDYVDSYYGLAEVLAAEGNFDKALEIYAERVKRHPSTGFALKKMASFLMRQRRPDEAKACLDQALALMPNSPSMQIEMGDLLAAQGKVAAARAHYETALRLRPGWPPLLDRLAKIAPQ